MLIAKKYYLFHGLDRKKAGLKRVRIAKKNHSSLLPLSPLKAAEKIRSRTCFRKNDWLNKYNLLKKEFALKLRKVHFLLISTFILILSQPSLAQAKLKNQFSILYTNDLMGEVEPCG